LLFYYTKNLSFSKYRHEEIISMSLNTRNSHILITENLFQFLARHEETLLFYEICLLYDFRFFIEEMYAKEEKIRQNKEVQQSIYLN